jgi:uncharacterized protein (DUF427 family)
MSTSMLNLFVGGHELLRHEPLELRVRATLGADTIADSTRALLIWEPRRVVPHYAVPESDIRGELRRAPAVEGHAPPVLHPGIPFSVHTADGEPVSIGGLEGAGFRLADEDLDGYVVLDFDAFDAWYEEDEQITGHPRDPFHRVDVRRSSRPLRIEVDGQVIAETTAARVVVETGLPTRFYLPREDVRAELRPSARRTYCPYKGQASYWSVGDHEDLAWCYESPLPDMLALTGLLAFWDERVDVFLDGERRETPTGAFADALRDEFGVGR